LYTVRNKSVQNLSEGR